MGRMSRTKAKPRIQVRYKGVIDKELTPEDIDLDSIKKGIMDVLMGRTTSMGELIEELVKEGRLSEKEAEELRERLIKS